MKDEQMANRCTSVDRLLGLAVVLPCAHMFPCIVRLLSSWETVVPRRLAQMRLIYKSSTRLPRRTSINSARATVAVKSKSRRYGKTCNVDCLHEPMPKIWDPLTDENSESRMGRLFLKLDRTSE